MNALGRSLRASLREGLAQFLGWADSSQRALRRDPDPPDPPGHGGRLALRHHGLGGRQHALTAREHRGVLPLAPLAATLIAAAPGTPLPRAPRCPSLPPASRSPSAWTGCRSRRTRRSSSPRSAWTPPPTPTSAPAHTKARTIGIPFDVVSKRDAALARALRLRGRVRPRSATRSRPASTSRAASDRHALLVDRDWCRLYELFALRRSGGGWTAGSGAVWNLRHPKLRPAGWTSADAAGLPILPLLARWDEARTGHIRHALRITVPRTRDAYVFPARHRAGDGNDPSLPRMGERVRLKASVKLVELPAAGPDDPARAARVRRDRGRQRLGLVRLRRARPALEQRPAAHAGADHRARLRGGAASRPR